MRIRIIRNLGNNWKTFEGFMESVFDFIYAFLKIALFGFIVGILWNNLLAFSFSLPTISLSQSMAIIVIGHIVTGEELIKRKIDVFE